MPNVESISQYPCRTLHLYLDTIRMLEATAIEEILSRCKHQKGLGLSCEHIYDLQWHNISYFWLRIMGLWVSRYISNNTSWLFFTNVLSAICATIIKLFTVHINVAFPFTCGTIVRKEEITELHHSLGTHILWAEYTNACWEFVIRSFDDECYYLG